MADTYSQIYIQIVFAVEERENLIQPQWEDELYKYITGIVKSKKQKLLAINGAYDHIHIFLEIKPSCNLSDLVREIKKSSSIFIKGKGFTPFNFNWQEGFGAFSYNHKQIPEIANYIQNQKEHHKKRSFREEYLGILQSSDISYKEQYLFHWFE